MLLADTMESLREESCLKINNKSKAVELEVLVEKTNDPEARKFSIASIFFFHRLYDLAYICDWLQISLSSSSSSKMALLDSRYASISFDSDSLNTLTHSHNIVSMMSVIVSALPSCHNNSRHLYETLC